MTEINELEGEELAAAAAEARGWHLFTDIGGRQCWASGDEAGWHKSLYRPDEQISLAWELDGEGWLWSYYEEIASEWAEGGGHPIVLTAEVEGASASSIYSSVLLADFPTKAQAYATARCRAFLKAKAKGTSDD